MSLSFAYSPDYEILVKQPGGRYFRLNTMQSVDATLVTSAGQNQMRVMLYDVNGAVSRLSDDHGKLHPMQAIRLRIPNRYGQWGTCFTGYITGVHSVFDQGDAVQVLCAGPDHLWDITRTSAPAAYALAVAQMRNVAASEVLLYSADQVGYPRNMITIDPVVDSGTGLQNSIQDVTYNPQAQQWMAVIQGLIGNSGLEWFFDEDGKSYWRRQGYLNVPKYGYRQVYPEELIHADLAESDDNVVTQVKVRYSTTGSFMIGSGLEATSAAVPQTMVNHLHERDVVIYVPYLQSGFGAAAQYLADVLLQQYAANVMTATVTLPADPMFRLATVCEVPSLRDDGSRLRYYITSVTYQLQWNGAWQMTLGLLYGRVPGANFPYHVRAAYPQWTAAEQADAIAGGYLPNQYQLAGLALDPQNPSDATQPFTVVEQAGIPADTVKMDASIMPKGSRISFRGMDKSHKGIRGDYIVQEGPASAAGAYVIYVPVGSHLPNTVLIKIISLGDSGTTLNTDASGGTPPLSYQQNGTGTNDDPGPGATGHDPVPLSTPNICALKALAAAKLLQGQPYVPYCAGPDYWDCSGLVCWVYSGLGFTGMLFSRALTINGHAENKNLGPNGVWTYFSNQGAGQIIHADGDPIRPDEVEPGDLLFIHTSDPAWASQAGYCHVGFYMGKDKGGVAWTFNANSTKLGIGPVPLQGYYGLDANHTPFDRALRMRSVQCPHG